jgi:drug/metabolite transporter (DMT)-like permease
MNWLFFLLLSLFWGLSFIAIRFSVEEIPPFGAAGLRVLIATAVFAGLIALKRIPLRASRSLVIQVGSIGILNFAVPWACLFWGEKYVSPSLASILNSTVPIWVLCLSWWLLAEERATWLKVSGVGLGFVGILIIFSPALRHEGMARNSLAGMIAIVVMAVSYSLAAITMKRVLRAMDIRWNLTLQGLVGFSALLALSFLTEGTGWLADLGGSPKAVGSLVYLAVFSMALAWLLYAHLLKTWGVLRSSAVTYLVPVVSILVDWLYYGMWPRPHVLGGAALIIGGIALINLGRARNALTILSLDTKQETIS